MDKLLVINNQQTTFAASRYILRLMEGERSQMTNTTERLPLIIRVNSLRRILHNNQIMFFRYLHNCLHVACHTSIMHRYNHARTRSNKRLQTIRI